MAIIDVLIFINLYSVSTCTSLWVGEGKLCWNCEDDFTGLLLKLTYLAGWFSPKYSYLPACVFGSVQPRVFLEAFPPVPNTTFDSIGIPTLKQLLRGAAEQKTAPEDYGYVRRKENKSKCLLCRSWAGLCRMHNLYIKGMGFMVIWVQDQTIKADICIISIAKARPVCNPLGLGLLFQGHTEAQASHMLFAVAFP